MNALLSWLWYKNRKLPLKESISPDYYRPVKRYFSRIRKEANLSPIEFKWDDRWFADRLGCGESLIASATLMLVFDHCVNPTSAYDIENKPLSNEFGVPFLHLVKKRAKSKLFKFLPINISVSTDEVIRVVANATKVYDGIFWMNLISMISIFSSLTRKGLYFIFFPLEGIVNP